MVGEARSQPEQCTEDCDEHYYCAGLCLYEAWCSCGGVCVSESAYVECTDVARLAKLASLLPWCRVFFGMLGTGAVASHHAPVLRNAVGGALQACRGEGGGGGGVVAAVAAVWSWGMFPREGLQGLHSGQGSAAWTRAIGFGRPCDPAGRVPAVQDERVDGVPDSVHRQSALTSCCAAETRTHSANCAEDH